MSKQTALKPVTILTFERRKESQAANEQGAGVPEVITLQFTTYPSLYKIEQSLNQKCRGYFVHSEWFLIKCEQIEGQ